MRLYKCGEFAKAASAFEIRVVVFFLKLRSAVTRLPKYLMLLITSNCSLQRGCKHRLLSVLKEYILPAYVHEASETAEASSEREEPKWYG